MTKSTMCGFCVGWFVSSKEVDSGELVLCCLDPGSTYIKYTLRITPDYHWTLLFKGTPIQLETCLLLADLSSTVRSAGDVQEVIEEIDSYRVCESNSDEKFLKL